MNNNSMEFVVKSHGTTSNEAFRASEISDAKGDYINIDLPDNADPYEFAANLIQKMDKRVSDADGPAGCVDISATTYGLLEEVAGEDKVFLFFGWVHY